jgi:hypothetical protein
MCVFFVLLHAASTIHALSLVVSLLIFLLDFLLVILFVLILVSLILPCCQLLCPLSIPFPANLSSLELHLSYLVIFLSLLVLSSSLPALLSDGTFTFWRLKRAPLMVEIRVTRGQKGDTAMQVNISIDLKGI